MDHWRSHDFVLRGPENRGAAGAEFETPKASRAGKGMGSGYPPPQPTRRSGEHRKLPQQILVLFELEKKQIW